MPWTNGFVGRHAELSQLGRTLTDVTGPAVVVSGEPGVGKTALIEAFCALAADGWRVVRILGVEAEASYALGGLNQLVSALEEFQAGLGERDRVTLAPVCGGEPDSTVVVLPLATAVLNLLSAAGRSRPVLVVADDAHWLDGVSAQVLAAAGRRLADPAVRIIASRRTTDESAFPAAGWTDLLLGPLDTDDAVRLLQRAGVELSAAAATEILAAAEGNPLALAELPRYSGRSDDRPDEGLGNLPLTDRLVAVFGARLDELDAGVRNELLRAALDGLAGGLPSSTGARYVMRNTAPAVKAGLLMIDPLGENVFRHPLVRAAVIHQADPQDRRDAHRDLARLYHDVLVRRAAHLAAATTEPDQDVAEVLAAAAKLSIRRGGLSVGAQWLHKAATLSTEPDRRAALLADAVFLAARADRPGGAEDLLETAATDERDSPLAVLAESYRAFHTDGEVISTHRRILRALAEANALDDKTVNRLVYLLVSITNYADTERYRQQTNAALQPLADRLDPAVSLYRTGVADFAETADAVRSMLRGYLPVLPNLSAQRLALLSFPAYCVGAMAEFRAPLHSAFARLREQGPSVDAIECGRVVLVDLITAGDWQGAEQVGADCLQMAERIECSQLRRQQVLADLGVLAAGRGEVATARGYAAEVRAWSNPRGLHRLTEAADRIEARVGLAEADYEAAYRAASRINPPYDSGTTRYNGGHDMAEDLLDAVEAAVHTGRIEEARDLAARAVRLNLTDVSPRGAAVSAAVSAMTAPDCDAEAHYQSALAHPDAAEFPFEHARIELAYGMWLRRARRLTEARTTLGEAAARFERLGAAPWSGRAHAELRAAGASSKRGLEESAPLSAQQRRIAELAATGATSKEIAAQLSLSPRTVDAHLSRLFRRLGITRRAGLSQALRDCDAGSPPQDR